MAATDSTAQPIPKPPTNKPNPMVQIQLINKTEEDEKLKETIDQQIENVLNADLDEALRYLESLIDVVKKETTSMTSVPKPFKFLNQHYSSLIEKFNNLPDGRLKSRLADLLSVLSMAMGAEDGYLTIQYLQQGTQEDYMLWGHEYLLHLSKDIMALYNKRLELQTDTSDLMAIANQIIKYFMQTNTEHDAIDLMLEVDMLDQLTEFATPQNYARISDYLLACSELSIDSDEHQKTLETAYKVCLNTNQYVAALRFAIKMQNIQGIQQVFSVCQDPLIRQQMCFCLARQRLYIAGLPEKEDTILSGVKLTEFYEALAKDLNIIDAKHPTQVYKTGAVSQKSVESAKMNLADTYVNAFVNAGTKKDTMLLQPKDPNRNWVDAVRNDGRIAAIGALGVLNMWDIEQLSIDLSPYMNLADGFSKIGAGIAIGLSAQGLYNVIDPAKAILGEWIGQDPSKQFGAVLGLGFAYAGSSREDLLDYLVPLVIDTGLTGNPDISGLEISAFAALSLGLIFIGKGNDNAANAIIQTLCERTPIELSQSMSRFFAVALGLLYMGMQEECETIIETLDVLNDPLSKRLSNYKETYAKICVESCAYLGTGNVLKVQELLHHVMTKKEEEPTETKPDEIVESQSRQSADDAEKDSSLNPEKNSAINYKDAAILGMSLIASGEDIGGEMFQRLLNTILQFGDPAIRSTVPLSLALANISNPKINVMDTLVKLSHEETIAMCHNSIIALGLVGAGTNNSRLADLLRNFTNHYEQDSNEEFLIRIAQGLLHSGKGMLSMNPVSSDRFIPVNIAYGGLLIFLHGCFDGTTWLLGKQHWLFFYLCLAAYPRMLFTVDENLESLPISVRVGQAVDVTGQAGKQRKITSFQTHNSPVIIAYGERAELATEEYIPIQDQVLENIVIVKKNPDYVVAEEKAPLSSKMT